MEIWFYEVENNKLKTIAIIDKIISIMWVKRFFKGDSFEIKLPPTDANLKIAKPDNIVSFNDSCGVITEINIGQDITIKGVSIDGLLSKRLLRKFADGDSLLTIIDKNVGNLANELYRFPAVNIDYSVDCDGGYASGFYNDNMDLYVETIGKAQDFGVLSRINHKNNTIELFGRFAQNFSKNQSFNKQVVFSDVYDNVSDINYTFSASAEINVAYVRSLPQYDSAAHIDIGGFFEIYYNGDFSGFRLSDKTVEIEPRTKVEYRQVDEITSVAWTVLDREATAKAAQEAANKIFSVTVENVDCKLILNPDQAQIFDVGDIVTVNVNQYNFTQNKRISELTTFENANKRYVEATLGDPQKTFTELIRIRK